MQIKLRLHKKSRLMWEAMDSIEILLAYTGTVVSDALCAYRQYRESGHGLCGAHLLRELTYISES